MAKTLEELITFLESFEQAVFEIRIHSQTIVADIKMGSVLDRELHKLSEFGVPFSLESNGVLVFQRCVLKKIESNG